MPAPYSVPLYLIPITPGQNQSFKVGLNGTDYRMRLLFNEVGETPLWFLDIGDASGVPLVTGIPLLTGQNLLAPFDYLEIGGGGALFCAGPNINPDPPTMEGLGSEWQLYFAPPTNAVTQLSGLAFVPPDLAGASLG